MLTEKAEDDIINAEKRAAVFGEGQKTVIDVQKSGSGDGGASGKMGNVFLPLRPPKISLKERIRLSHEIATFFPQKKPGDIFGYENRDHFYIVKVHEFGKYSFEARIPLTDKNKTYIDILRKELSKNGK